jgi:hypothetical protein
MIVFGGVKAPRRIEFVAGSPRSAAGNVPKRQFRERFREGRERRVTAWGHTRMGSQALGIALGGSRKTRCVLGHSNRT